MRISQVEYQELRSGPNFSNQTVGAVGVVEEGEHPDDALREVREWVQRHIGRDVEMAQQTIVAETRVEQLEWRKRELERLIGQAEDKWKRARAFLEKHGISTEYDDLPF